MKMAAPALAILVLSIAALRVYTGTMHLTKAASARSSATDELIALSVALSNEIARLEGPASERNDLLRAIVASFGGTLRDGQKSLNDAQAIVEIPLRAANRSATNYRGIIGFSGHSIVGMRVVADRAGAP